MLILMLLLIAVNGWTLGLITMIIRGRWPENRSIAPIAVGCLALVSMLLAGFSALHYAGWY